MNKMKRKHKEGSEYIRIMEKYINGELTDEQILELEEDIRSWELFKITSLIGLSSSDIDGVPTPILIKELRDIDKWDFNGGEDKKSYIRCFDIKQFTKDEDNKNLHKSVTDRYGDTYKNVGEYYRSLKYQSMLYGVYFKMNG